MRITRPTGRRIPPRQRKGKREGGCSARCRHGDAIGESTAHLHRGGERRPPPRRVQASRRLPPLRGGRLLAAPRALRGSDLGPPCRPGPRRPQGSQARRPCLRRGDRCALLPHHMLGRHLCFGRVARYGDLGSPVVLLVGRPDAADRTRPRPPGPDRERGRASASLRKGFPYPFGECAGPGVPLVRALSRSLDRATLLPASAAALPVAPSHPARPAPIRGKAARAAVTPPCSRIASYRRCQAEDRQDQTPHRAAQRAFSPVTPCAGTTGRFGPADARCRHRMTVAFHPRKRARRSSPSPPQERLPR